MIALLKQMNDVMGNSNVGKAPPSHINPVYWLVGPGLESTKLIRASPK